MLRDILATLGALHLAADLLIVLFFAWFLRSSKREAERLDEDN